MSPIKSQLHAKRRALAAVALAGAALGLAACSSDSGGDTDAVQTAGETAPNIVQPGAPGQPSTTVSPEALETIRMPEHTLADVEFMQGMIHHHAQALLMTNLVDERTASKDIPLLAERMQISQESEIEVMQKWLRDRDQEAPDAHVPHGHAHGPGGELMPGMLTEQQLAQLKAAKGERFDRLFLEFMIQHHQGALQMVHELFDENGGAEPEINIYARHVEADQAIEIGRMQQLLAQMDAKR